ncbi:MAG: DUF11 domain-containing protein, partial [Planctomycetota bacterium]
SGNLVNTATVSAPAGTTDINPANNSATDTDTPVTAFDLAISKTDGVPTYTPGTSTTYSIVVSNNGPSAVVGAAVNDLLPASINSAAWSTFASAGASVATPSGTGSIVNNLVNLVPGASVTFTLVAAVSPSASGNLVNTATVSAPAGTTDVNPANNSASISTPIDVPVVPTDFPEMKIVKTATPNPVTVGSGLTYSLVVSNHSLTTATGVTVVDTLPTGFAYLSASGQNSATISGNILTLYLGTLGKEGSGTDTVMITVMGQVTTAAASTITNTAVVFSDNMDPNANPADFTSSVVTSVVHLLALPPTKYWYLGRTASSVSAKVNVPVVLQSNSNPTDITSSVVTTVVRPLALPPTRCRYLGR